MMPVFLSIKNVVTSKWIIFPKLVTNLVNGTITTWLQKSLDKPEKLIKLVKNVGVENER